MRRAAWRSSPLNSSRRPTMSIRALRSLAQALARTWRIDARGEERIIRLRAAGIPILYAVWHGHLLAPLWHRRGQGIALLVSTHEDGGRLATAATGWGYSVVRGSSTRGGFTGLRGLLRALRGTGHGAVTPDGPRGPARVVKPGLVAAAQHSGAAIVPVTVAASAAWQLDSWDRFVIPQPFARVRIDYGAPIAVETGLRARGGATALLTERLAATPLSQERTCGW